MKKSWIIARREYFALVATKGFLLGLIIMPILMMGGIFIARFVQQKTDVGERKIAVADGTGKFFAPLKELAEARNAALKDAATGKSLGPSYVLESVATQDLDDERRLELSDQVRAKEYHAFIEIPAALEGTLSVPASAAPTSPPSPPQLAYYADNAALSEIRSWFEQTIAELIKQRRFQAAGVEPGVAQWANARVPVTPTNLLERAPDGSVQRAKPVDRMTAIFLPMGVMMLMFMTIWMAAQPALETALEEKQQRIADVLLGTANSFEIMFGKLLGGVAGSLTILAVYAGVGYLAAWHFEATDMIPFHILPLFLVFQVLAVMFVSSLFMAIGASANSLKEAQGLLLPVWLLIMSPLFTWINVVQDPTGTLALTLSFFPPATPMIMALRLAAMGQVPVWEVALAIVLVVITTLACVFAAARIFRIGMLSQGNTPSLMQLIRWGIFG